MGHPCDLHVGPPRRGHLIFFCMICMAFIVTGFLGYACAVPHYVRRWLGSVGIITFEELVMTNHHWALSGGVSGCSIVSSEAFFARLLWRPVARAVDWEGS